MKWGLQNNIDKKVLQKNNDFFFQIVVRDFDKNIIIFNNSNIKAGPYMRTHTNSVVSVHFRNMCASVKYAASTQPFETRSMHGSV